VGLRVLSADVVAFETKQTLEVSGRWRAANMDLEWESGIFRVSKEQA